MIHSSLYPPIEYPTEPRPVKKSVPFKYREDELITKLYDYIASTYSSHYVGQDNIQSNDLIFALGHGDGFCIGNIIKYTSRYGKKKGANERDEILKILHYALLLLFLYEKSEVY